MLPAAATEFYALQQRVNFAATNEARRLWASMGDDFDASWRRVSPGILAVLIEGQQVMAEAALEYVPAVLAETDLHDRPEGDLRPGALVGRASDGRRLDTLAYGAVTQAKAAVAEGASTAAALDAGSNWLDLMARLQVADAARQAVGVMTASRKNLGGTIRVLNPPSCQRCAILAGRFYRWSKGFDRHPRCDCVNLPSRDIGWAEAEGFLTDPMDAYRKGQIKDLTGAQVKALSEGADINEVVNAYRGMSTTITRRSVRTSTPVASAAARGVRAGMPDLLAGVKFAPATGPAHRLTPEGIYQQAAGDRDKAIALLREWGYIT